MKRVLLALFLFGSSFICAQSYLGLDGGLEGSATIDNTNTYSSPQTSLWTKSGSTIKLASETSTVRSGGHAVKISMTSTTLKRVYSPQFTITSTTNKFFVQCYRRSSSTTNTQTQDMGVIRGVAEMPSSPSYKPVSLADTWEKVTYAPTSITEVATVAGVIFTKAIGTGGDVYIDDFCIYAATNVDNSAPDSPTNPIIAKGSNEGEINVSWTAPVTGIDNGGYLVLRKDGSAPSTDPNVNGIYAATNSIGDGTVAYVGTSISFIDVGLTVGHTYYYKIYTFDKAYNYSTATSSVYSEPLPVELTSFMADVVEKKVFLNWATSNEVNNYGFDVERKSENADWIKIGFVEGNGNSNSPKSYSFTDEPKGGKEFHYRLKQIDLDGSYEYSDEVTATLEHVNEFVLDQNFPNPFNPITRISYTLPERASVRLKIYDMLAKEVSELVNGYQEAGRYEVTFDGSSLSSGTYFYKLEAGSFVEVKKLVLIK